MEMLEYPPGMVAGFPTVSNLREQDRSHSIFMTKPLKSSPVISVLSHLLPKSTLLRDVNTRRYKPLGATVKAGHHLSSN